MAAQTRGSGRAAVLVVPARDALSQACLTAPHGHATAPEAESIPCGDTTKFIVGPATHGAPPSDEGAFRRRACSARGRPRTPWLPQYRPPLPRIPQPSRNLRTSRRRTTAAGPACIEVAPEAGCCCSSSHVWPRCRPRLAAQRVTVQAQALPPRPQSLRRAAPPRSRRWPHPSRPYCRTARCPRSTSATTTTAASASPWRRRQRSSPCASRRRLEERPHARTHTPDDR